MLATGVRELLSALEVREPGVYLAEFRWNHTGVAGVVGVAKPRVGVGEERQRTETSGKRGQKGTFNAVFFVINFENKSRRLQLYVLVLRAF